jgi:hypothetical protein
MADATRHKLPPASALQHVYMKPAQAAKPHSHLATAVGRRSDRARGWLLLEARVTQQLCQAFVLRLLHAKYERAHAVE